MTDERTPDWLTAFEAHGARQLAEADDLRRDLAAFTDDLLRQLAEVRDCLDAMAADLGEAAE